MTIDIKLLIFREKRDHSFMAPKASRFYNEANDWFCNASLPSDLTIVINEVNFHLHKFPLLSRCGKIEKLIKETKNNDTIILDDIPGGTNAFLIAVKFCYGVHMELTPTNIVMVYCVSDYLEMSDEYGDDNLLSKAKTYFHENVLKNWKDCIVALQSCEKIIKRGDNLEIIGKCLNGISTMVCTDPSLFGWPMTMYGGRLQSPGGSILWNGISTGAGIQTSESEWWFEDVSCLCVGLFKRLIKAMVAKGIQPEKLTGAIMYYSGKCLHGLGRWQGGKIIKPGLTTKYDINDQRVLLESIVDLLPQTKGKSICRFLLGLLRVGLILNVSDKCRDSIERRIGMQLEFATLDGIMIPSYSDSDTLYNTECVETMINHFINFEESDSDSKALPNVSKLIDSYLAEIASDANLKPEKMRSLLKALPESSRDLNDGLYRALDIYFEAHLWLTDKQKESLCDIIDWKKLSVDACDHVSQNKRIPLRVVVLQVLFFEQMHMKRAIAGCLNVVDDENNPTTSLVRENELLKVDMEMMRGRVIELEEEFNKLRKEMTRISRIHL